MRSHDADHPLSAKSRTRFAILCHIMIVLSVLAFLVLLECLAWFLRKVDSWRESLPQARPSSDPYTLSYQDTPPQARVYSYPRLSPQLPADGYYQAKSQYSTYTAPSQYLSYQSYHQPSTRFPTPNTPLLSNDVRYAYEQIPSSATTQAPDVTVAPLVSGIHEDYESLRLKARREGDRMAECFHQSKEAFASNQKRLAKELSNMGRAHKENMVCLDKEASAKIFEENNQGCNSNTVDLHGLYVTEAEFYFKRTLELVRDRGESSLRVIVGKGNHSDGNNPKIKPAIRVLGKRYVHRGAYLLKIGPSHSLGVTVNVDPVNEGCLNVNC